MYFIKTFSVIMDLLVPSTKSSASGHPRDVWGFVCAHVQACCFEQTFRLQWNGSYKEVLKN